MNRGIPSGVPMKQCVILRKIKVGDIAGVIAGSVLDQVVRVPLLPATHAIDFERADRHIRRVTEFICRHHPPGRKRAREGIESLSP